ncbi:hypothetical protein H0H87_005651 [Tephrocybe sp. NHM501043]|nr:hypothetical protein H0H87_005651 [Tephrocybe sp. NHM501043]
MRRCVKKDVECEKGPVGTLPTAGRPSQQVTQQVSSFNGLGAPGLDDGVLNVSVHALGGTPAQLAKPLAQQAHGFDNNSSFHASDVGSPPYATGPGVYPASYFDFSVYSPSSGAPHALPTFNVQPLPPPTYDDNFGTTCGPLSSVTPTPAYARANVSDFYSQLDHTPRVDNQHHDHVFGQGALPPHSSPDYIYRDSDAPGSLPAQIFGQTSAIHGVRSANVDFVPSTFTLWSDVSYTTQGMYDSSGSIADDRQRSTTGANA